MQDPVIRELEAKIREVEGQKYALRNHLIGFWDAIIMAQVSLWIIVYIATILVLVVVFDQKAIAIVIGITVAFEFCMHRLYDKLDETKKEILNEK